MYQVDNTFIDEGRVADTHPLFCRRNMYACEIYKLSLWKKETNATAGVKRFQFVYKVRIHVRPDEDDLAAVKLTYLQVFFLYADCRAVIHERVRMYKAQATALDGAYRVVVMLKVYPKLQVFVDPLAKNMKIV